MKKLLIASLVAAFLLSLGSVASAQNTSLLNVSYSPTSELYKQFNAAFATYWKEKTGTTVSINQSNGSSGKQSQSVQEGLEADVVTLALAYDIDAIADRGLLKKDWQLQLPNNSSPYTSTIVFVVRKGNPKNIQNWDDLVRPGIGVITPNPKASGGARWAFLAAWGYEQLKTGSADQARTFVQALYKNVSVLDPSARGSTISFTQKGLGDVLITWENEAQLVLRELGPDKYDIVTPPVSILTEPPVAVVDSNVDKHGTRTVAEAYLKFLYSKRGQKIAAANGYRPQDKAVADQFAAKFPKVKLFKLSDLFGTWREIQKKYFNDGGIFDQIYGDQ